MLSKYQNREKTYYCGKNYIETDLIPEGIPPEQKRARGRRRKTTEPVQKNLNDKNSKRYLGMLLKTNFANGDLWTTLTYSDKHLPKSAQEAKNELRNYVRRLNTRCKKAGYKNIEYIVVTEQSAKGRHHHHVVIKTKLTRDEVEETWSKGRGRKKEKIGIVNCRYIQENEDGLAGIANYITKKTLKGKKSWSSSQGLEKPEVNERKKRYTRRKLNELRKSGEIYTREYWEKRYKGYYLTGEVEEIHSEITGYSYYIKMRR